jgi:type I restriction enzyme S subunit
MDDDATRVRLGDLVRQGALTISDGYRVRNEELGPEGVPFVRGGDIGDGWVNTDTQDRIRPEFADRVRMKIARPNDVAFITKGTVGRAGRLRFGQPPVVFAPQVSYWRVNDTSVLDPGFIFYLVRSRDFQAALDGVKTHGAMVADYVSLSQQYDFRLHIPDITTQRAIGRILGSLDDKIDLNRRISATLEAVARAFFKSWFVDFDPVHAKSEGRDPGLPGPLTALFPASFESSPSGRIPTGWRVQRIGDVLALEKGLSYKGDFLADTGTPMVNLGCFLGRGRFSVKAIKHYRGEYRDRHLVGSGDLVIANTDITQKREVIGSPALVPPRNGTPGLIFSHHVFAARFHPGAELWKHFVFFALLQEAFRERARGFATGTTVLALPRDAVLDFVCPVPPARLLSAFDSLARPLVERQWRTVAESEVLVAVRDALLPRVMSGELRVSDADRLMDEAPP